MDHGSKIIYKKIIFEANAWLELELYEKTYYDLFKCVSRLFMFYLKTKYPAMLLDFQNILKDSHIWGLQYNVASYTTDDVIHKRTVNKSIIRISLFSQTQHAKVH